LVEKLIEIIVDQPALYWSQRLATLPS